MASATLRSWVDTIMVAPGPVRCATQQSDNLSRAVRVQGTSGLVTKNDLRSRHESPGHRNPLSLAAGQLSRPHCRRVVQAHCRERALHHPVVGSSASHPPGQSDVLLDRELGEQLTELEDHGDLVPTMLRACTGRSVREVQTRDDHPARVGLDDPGQDVEQGGLARSARAHDGRVPTGGHNQIQVTKNETVAVGETQTVTLDCGLLIICHLTAFQFSQVSLDGFPVLAGVGPPSPVLAGPVPKDVPTHVRRGTNTVVAIHILRSIGPSAKAVIVSPWISPWLRHSPCHTSSYTSWSSHMFQWEYAMSFEANTNRVRSGRIQQLVPSWMNQLPAPGIPPLCRR